MTTRFILSIMDSMTRVKEVLDQVLTEIPASQRRLAEASGLTHGALGQVRRGRSGLEPETVRRIIAALRGWSDRCSELADELERALEADQAGKGGA